MVGSSNADETDEVSNMKQDYNFLHGKLLARPLPGDEIVITGVAGAFPNSSNVEEFKNNLFNKIPMVTPNRRWGYIHSEIPECSGCLPEIDKFDAGFFGIHERQGQVQDTMSRLILEKAVEAVFDAGLHPTDLASTRTGVFIGACFSETEKTTFFDSTLTQTYGVTGCSRNMIAHRVSYYLKLKGPSFIVDTACSSSLYALEHAFRSLRLGEVDTAIVGGVNLCLHPFVTLQFARLGVLSIDGSCKVFDEAANGYARAESVGILILQRAKDAKRNYAEIVYAKSNCDGYKETGITFPSRYAQRSLMKEFYDECGIDRFSLSYLEAHGTGTSIGDPEETSAIDDVLTKGKETRLLIGSVKSNIGHSEPASGVASVVKCIIGLETGIIPPNYHFSKPNKNITGLIEGRMKVVSEPMPFEDDRGLIGINSFGFGGGNCHILLRKNKKEKINYGLPSDNIPRIICISGRTEESVITLLDVIKNNVLDVEHIRLLHSAFRKPVPNHLFRGFSIRYKSEEICRFFDRIQGNCIPLYLAFGELNDWHTIGNQLMDLPAFSDSIQRIQENISIHGVNIKDTFRNPSSGKEKYHILGSVVVQVGLINLLKLLKIEPNNCYGYSFGGLLAAYANGIITSEETVNYALIINDSINEICDFYKISNGGKQINTNDVPLLDRIREKLKSEKSTREQVIQNLTNSIRLNKINKQLTDQTLALADCFVESLSNDISRNFGHVEKNSIFLTVGKFHLAEDIEDVKVIPFFHLGSEGHLQGFLKVLGNLYVNGHSPQLANLYPEVQFPVSRGTRMISPYIKWKHDSRQWFHPMNDFIVKNIAQQGTRSVKIQLSDQEWSYVSGHVVDGRNLFPATGYLFLAAETLSIIDARPLAVKHIAFENCKFIRATSVPNKGFLVLKIALNIVSGNFEINDGDSTVMSGRVYVTEEPIKNYSLGGNYDNEHLKMKTRDIYKDLTLRGYNYKGNFRNIVSCNIGATEGRIRWENNWVTFLDNMLQLKILGTDSRLLYVPTFIEHILIPAREQIRWIKDEFIDKGLEPILSVYCDPSTGDIRSGYTVIKGLIASSIPTRKDLGIPVLEKYLFIPNITSLELYDSIRVNTQIFLENALMNRVKVVELMDEFTKDQATPLTPIIKTAFEDQPLIQLLPKILSKDSLDVTIPVENKKLCEEKDCSLIIVSKLFERPGVLQTALASLKDHGFLISRESPDFNTLHTNQLDVSIYTVHNIQSENSETIVLVKKNHKTKNSVSLKIDSSDDFTWIKKTQGLIKNKSSDDLILFSDNRNNNGILGLVNCLRREPASNFIRCLFVMDEVQDINVEDHLYKEQLKKNMAINIFKNGVWGTYRHLIANDCNKAENEHCFANTKLRGDLSSLQWFQGPLRTDMNIPPEKNLVHIHYAALNFRDVMTASGKINVDIVTTDRTQQECIQGLEFSGIDSDGKRVMGMINFGALASLALADRYVTIPVPDELSLKEAATMPVVYCTVIMSVVMRARLKEGESLLIHAGTGGVGQAAIRIALKYGCEVFTTVGTPEKRDYIKKLFPSLKDQHIGNSRDTSFETMVMRGTKGRGVDVVLNSLSDEKLQASIRCLARGGRFVEIGKFDLSKNSQCNLLLLEREASFHGVMLDQIFMCHPAEKAAGLRLLRRGAAEGYMKPLDPTVFKFDQLEEAFRFMASGKHMGKVIIQVREPETAPVFKFPCTARYSCNPTDSYIICGGLGGFGLELADWLVLRGARKLVLTSRKGVSTGYQEYRIHVWDSYGVAVHISTTDITTKEGCRSLIENAQELGPVKAIFNLAVVLADALFENQTKESFSTSFGPKPIATKYLDEISRELCPNLSDFVVFSSVTCGRGNAGQTNYGMANSIMERICEERVKAGYPGLAIQWGAIGQVGLVAEMQEVDQELEIGGTLQQKISSCLNVLDGFLKQKSHTIVSSMVVAEKKGGLEHADNIVDTVINILGVSDAKSVSLHATLAELGMDSMTGVEIKQTFEREYGVFLSAKDIRTMTLAKLRKIQEDRSKDTSDKIEKPTANLGIEMFFKIYQTEEELHLPYLQFKPKQGNSALLSKIILLPGIDGSGRAFEKMASDLKCESIALQYKYNNKPESISEMVNAMIPTIEKYISPEEPFTLVGYSFGSIIALEVVSILESKNYIGSLILIDGSPDVCRKILEELHSESDALYETYLLNHLMSFCLPSTVVTQNQEKLFNCKSWKERADMAATLVGNQINFKHATQKLIINGIYERLKAFKMYTQSYNKIKSKIILFKSTDLSLSTAEEDYGVSKLSEQPVDVHVFEGNHSTILDNSDVATVLDSIMSSEAELL